MHQQGAVGWERFLFGWRRTLISAIVVVLTLVVWSVCTTAITRTDDPTIIVGPENPESIRSVAYAVVRESRDEIYVRQIDGGEPRLLARLTFAFGARARGFASPDGSMLAIISVPGVAVTGQLSIWPMLGGPPIDVPGAFEYLTAIAWANDGTSLAAVQHAEPDETGRITAVILEVDALTGESTEQATFDRVTEAAPLGYGAEGELYIVTIDQGGSTLWRVSPEDELREVASLSPGKTRSWALSPDRSRLAYVEPSGSQPTAAGRILLLSTGQISGVPGQQHVGVAWVPGTDVAVFGGPDGELQFTDPGWAESGSYLVPLGWSPDGSTLAAKVFESLDGDRGSLRKSLELMTPRTRALLADEPEAEFFGWVVNPDQDGGAGE